MISNDSSFQNHNNNNVLSFVHKGEVGDSCGVNEIGSENSPLNINRTDSCSKKSEISTNLLNKIQLSTNSRNFLIVRIILLCLGCIFIPMEMILYNKLERVEINHTYPQISSIISDNTIYSNTFYYISYTFILILSNKDAIVVYISIVYMVSHPFVALKLVFTTNLIYYGMTIMKCLYQAKRPFWLSLSLNRFCYTSFANPSSNYFLVTFFFLYTLASLNYLKKKNERITWLFKFIFFITYIVILILSSGIFILNKINFVYQIIFTLCLTLIIICILLDFENSIHNWILKSMKNIFKTRKYKIKILFYVLTLAIVSVIIYFFIVPDNLNVVEENISNNPNCSKQQREELGVQYTFMEIPYIFGIIGSFWGASFTIEYDCSKWWNSNILKMSAKIGITIVFSVGYILLFKFVIVHVTYEFDFLIECLKYFVFYFIVMGLLPMLYHYIGLNEKRIAEEKGFKSLLFTKTIFTDSGNAFENVYFKDGAKDKKIPLFPEDDEQNNKKLQDMNEIDNKEEVIMEEEDEDEKDEEKLRGKRGTQKSNLYKKSHIIGDLQKHEDDKLEFTINLQEDYFNN